MNVPRRAVLALAAAVATGGCAESDGSRASGALPSGAWRTAGFDERNRAALSAGTAPPDLAEVWSVDVGNGPWSSPIVANDAVYVANESTLRDVSLSEGEFGSLELEARVTGTPTYDDGGLFVPTDSDDGGRLLRIQPDGTVDWRLDIPGGRPHAATVDDDVAIRTRAATSLVNRDGPTIVWSTDEPAYDVAGRDRFVDLSPALASEAVVVPSPDGIRCRERATGEERWHADVGRVAGSPAVADGTVYASVVSEGVVALDLDSGEEQWSVSASGCWTSPAVGEETVYATTASDLLAIDREDGTVDWRLDGHGLHGDSYSDPIVVGATVLAGSIGRSVTACAVDDGTVRTTIRGEGTRVSHAVGGERLVVADGPTLRCYRGV